MEVFDFIDTLEDLNKKEYVHQCSRKISKYLKDEFKCILTDLKNSSLKELWKALNTYKRNIHIEYYDVKFQHKTIRRKILL